jgi:citrate lyase subunit beta/citryl-CoA lyase
VSRSHLFVPGNAPGELAQALGHGADVLIVDLADAVPEQTKESTRGAVAEWLRGLPWDLDVWVRINPGPLGHDDVRQVLGPWLRGVCLAKTESTIQLDALDAVLSTVETEVGLPARTVAVMPVLESASAILAAPAIARAPRVVRLQTAEADLRLELGLELSEDERELLWVRSQVVLASAAAGLAAPVAAVSTEVRDLDQLRHTTTALKQLGFRGRACLDPVQVPVVNEVFGDLPG